MTGFSAFDLMEGRHFCSYTHSAGKCSRRNWITSRNCLKLCIEESLVRTDASSAIKVSETKRRYVLPLDIEPIILWVLLGRDAANQECKEVFQITHANSKLVPKVCRFWSLRSRLNHWTPDACSRKTCTTKADLSQLVKKNTIQSRRNFRKLVERAYKMRKGRSMQIWALEQ